MIKVSFECSNLQTSIEMVLVENFLEGKKNFYDCHTPNPNIWEVDLLMLLSWPRIFWDTFGNVMA
jgi:hypothetical protein